MRAGDIHSRATIAGLQESKSRADAERAMAVKEAAARGELLVHPVFEKGIYIARSITRIIVLVAKQADVSFDSIRGLGRVTRLVNARSCVAKLAEEFAPRLSAGAIDDAMLRGHGMTAWYRARHEDRVKLCPGYSELYERCRDELKAAGS